MNEYLVNATTALFSVSLQHSVELAPDEAVAWAEQVTPDLAPLISEVNELIPRKFFGKMVSGGNNPNNGQYAHTWRVGREYSEVLYLQWVEAYAPKGFPFETLTRDLGKIAERFNADEFWHVPEKRVYIFRFWWD